MKQTDVKAWTSTLHGSPVFTVLVISGVEEEQEVTVAIGNVNDGNRFESSDEALEIAWIMDRSPLLRVSYSTYYVPSGNGDSRDATPEEMEYINDHTDDVFGLAETLEGGRYTVDNPYYEEE